MKLRLTAAVVAIFCIVQQLKAQNISQSTFNAFKADDSSWLSSNLPSSAVNECDGYYSILSHAVRFGAIKCVTYLVNNGADVNKTCNGYIPPLMHAAKYGNLEIAKFLVSKGANISFQYDGNIQPVNGKTANVDAMRGKTALTYAEQFQKTQVAEYLLEILNKKN